MDPNIINLIEIDLDRAEAEEYCDVTTSNSICQRSRHFPYNRNLANEKVQVVSVLAIQAIS
jgi:hypothetical protein